jgi:hypothetical protein
MIIKHFKVKFKKKTITFNVLKISTSFSAFFFFISVVILKTLKKMNVDMLKKALRKRFIELIAESSVKHFTAVINENSLKEKRKTLK